MDLNSLIVDDKDILGKLVEGMRYTAEDLKSDSDIWDYNDDGVYLSVWAKRSALYRNSLARNRGILVHIKRATFWEFDVMYSSDTKALYVMMTAENFKRVQKKVHHGEQLRHYLRTLMKFNDKNTEPILGQMSLDMDVMEIIEKDASRLSSDFSELSSLISEPVDRAFLMVVSYDFSKEVSGVELLKLNSKLQEISSIQILDSLTKAKSPATAVSEIENVYDTELFDFDNADQAKLVMKNQVMFANRRMKNEDDD